MSSAARLRVRPAEARDLDRVCAIVNHFIETTAFNFRIESQQVEEWLHNWERLHRLYPWLVAIEGHQVIGVAYAAPWKERDAYLWTVESTVCMSTMNGTAVVWATPCTPSCWPGWNARVSDLDRGYRAAQPGQCPIARAARVRPGRAAGGRGLQTEALA